ncbi:hypothetical protein P692DRAFT_20743316 [Suillus brevipes Sb2]|nr:hypothetical protein P692DRAFT_20743316 [Suillus brevipes Sb2]
MPQNGPCSIRVIEGAVTPRACTARPKNSTQDCSSWQPCNKNTPSIALETSLRQHQRLKLSWCSSGRLRNNGCKLKLRSTLIQSRASSFCLMFYRSTYSTQSRVLRRDQTFISIMPISATKALDGGISSTDTVTRSLAPPTSPTRSHASLEYDPHLQ